MKTTSESKKNKFQKSETAKPESAAPLVKVERLFQAPIEKLWQAWSHGELIEQWWGPEGYSCPEAKVDFRQGGKYLLAMQAPDRKISWSGGVYKEIIPYDKIVCTDQFTDAKGQAVSAKDYGMPGEWPESLTVIVTFEKVSEAETRMVLFHEGIPGELQEDCFQGWNSSLDKLQRLVEQH